MHADSPRQLVVGHVISMDMKPSTNWTKLHYNTSDVGILLEYAFRVVCDVNYYGAGCSHYCRPRNDTHGHWTCAPDTGQKRCLPGWQGTYCETGRSEWRCCSFVHLFVSGIKVRRQANGQTNKHTQKRRY